MSPAHTASAGVTHSGRVVRAVLDLSRSRQAMLSVAQPALGAVLALGSLPSVRQMALGLIAASSGFLAVFSLNDILDRKVDVRALEVGKGEFSGFDLDTVYVRHPIAQGEISLGLAVCWVAMLAFVSVVAAYALAPLTLVFFGAAVKLEVLYCKLRSVTWLKTFVSGAMVGVGGLAGWVAVAPLSARAIPFFAFLALWEIAGRNLPNDLSDMSADRRTGIRTLATTFGPFASGRAVFAGAAATTAALAFIGMPALASLLALVAGVWAMGVPAFALALRPTPAAAAEYFNRASLLPALVLPVAILAVGLVR